MTRLKYVVASFVVLSGYHRLSNEDFIIRSFHGHDGPFTRRNLSNKGQRPQLGINYTSIYRMEPPEKKTYLGGYNVGEFCPYCTLNVFRLCIDLMKIEMKAYNRSEEEALEKMQRLARCTTPPMPHKVYANEDDEPSVILHVGPHKTGTTSLQALMYNLIYKNETIFVRDNLRVPSWDELPGVFAKEGVGLNLPHCSIENYKNDSGTMNIMMCDRMRTAFPKFLVEAYNKSQDVLIVAEDFDRKELNFERMRFFLQPYKRIKVMVTYRRLHDWLPSFYNQIVDHYLQVYVQGEDHYPSIVEWLGEQYDNFLKVHSVHVAERWRHLDIVESVDILNMHQIPDLNEHFFCNYLWASAACQAIKEGAKSPKSNIGYDHEFTRLTIRANLGGMIESNLHKPVRLKRAARYLESKVRENNVTLPRICPRKELLDQILETEMEQERTFFPEWYETQGGDEGLRRSFTESAQKKLCSFDVDQILESGALQSIFKEIG